jgi:tetratricopeptide (TPR) repeat protein
LERWAQLGEAERYQLNIAEKYYREQNWKVALSEYEKFLSLYEDGSGAPYAQLKWSLCQLQLRKPNTAIKDGFQSVIDYWPDSQEAVAASYLIGRAYKDMGEPKPAKKAYAAVLAAHPKHLVATLARVDLLDIARVEEDAPRRLALWRELAFQTERTPEAAPHCNNAARELAVHTFATGGFDEGIEALQTVYPPEQAPYQLVQHAAPPIANLASQDDTRPTAEKVADAAVAWLKSQIPADTADDAAKAAARTAWYCIADIQNAARRFDEVPRIYDQVMQTYGPHDETLGRLGAWLRTQARHADARNVYARFQSRPDGLAAIAASYREERNYDEAVRVFQNLAAEDPERAVQWLSSAAWSYREGGKCDEAVAVYTGLLTSDDEQPGRWQYEIGNTLKDFGRLKEAIAAYRQCDNFPDCYTQMAWCHRGLAEYQEAIALYLQIVAGYESSASWAILQMGYTYEQAGEAENAIKSFQQVCRRYPKTPHASEAHVHLNDAYKITVTLGGATDE